MAVDFSQKHVRCDTVLATDLGGEVVMMDIESGEYFSLTAVSARIWELLGEPASASEICTTLEAEYDVDSETCRTHVGEFLGQLADAKIIQAV